MDIDPSVSRDPRLSSRGGRPALPTRLSHHEAQQRPPLGPSDPPVSNSRNETPGDEFIRSISDLVESAVFAANSKSEREKLQKKRGTTEELLRKAKGYSGFPSTVEFFQHAKNDEDMVLASVDKKIKEHEANYRRLQADLKNRWAVSENSRNSDSDDKILQLQQDLNATNNKASSLHDNFSGLVSRNQSLEHELETFRETLRAQQKGFENYRNELGIQTNNLKEYSARVSQLENEASPENGRIADIRRVINSLSARTQALEEKTTTWGAKFDSLSTSHQKTLAFPDQVNQALMQHQQKLDQLVNHQPAGPKLESAVITLSNKLEELQNIQSAKDDLQFAMMEDLKKALTMVQKDHERLSGHVEQLSLSIPVEPIEPKLAILVNEIRDVQQRLESTSIGLRSLETRYNNLSTEPIVQQMVGAFQEMYPSIDQICKTMIGYKRSLDEDLLPLKKKVEQLVDGQAKSSAFYEELNVLRADRENLSRSVNEFLGRYDWFSKADYQGLQSRLEGLEGKQGNMDTEFTSKKTADQKFSEEIERERESINSQLKTLHYMVNNMTSEIAQAKSDTRHEKEIRALELRMATLQKETTERYQNLNGQVDNLEKTVQQPEPLQSESLHRGNPFQPDISSSTPDLLDTQLNPKIKRRHPSDDEESPGPGSRASPSQDSTASPIIAPRERKKTRKLKKKRRIAADNPIQID